MPFSLYDLRIGKLYYLLPETSCWNYEGSKLINYNFHSITVIMLVSSVLYENLHSSFAHKRVKVLLETGEIGFIYEHQIFKLELAK